MMNILLHSRFLYSTMKPFIISFFICWSIEYGLCTPLAENNTTQDYGKYDLDSHVSDQPTLDLLTRREITFLETSNITPQAIIGSRQDVNETRREEATAMTLVTSPYGRNLEDYAPTFLILREDNNATDFNETINNFKDRVKRDLEPQQEIEPTNVVSQNSTDEAPHNSTDAASQNGTDVAPQNGTDETPHKSTDAASQNGTDVVPQNGTDEILDSSTDLISHYSTELAPQNSTDAAPPNGTNTALPNSTFAIPYNSTDVNPHNDTEATPYNGTTPQQRTKPNPPQVVMVAPHVQWIPKNVRMEPSPQNRTNPAKPPSQNGGGNGVNTFILIFLIIIVLISVILVTIVAVMKLVFYKYYFNN